MRSICGSAALGGRCPPVARAGFDPTGHSCFFGLAAPEGAFCRLDAKDWALPFLGIALSRFRLFSMERVGMVWAPSVRGARIDARTTHSPANRGASPWRAGGEPIPPANAPNNAYYAAEVPSILPSFPHPS